MLGTRGQGGGGRDDEEHSPECPPMTTLANPPPCPGHGIGASSSPCLTSPDMSGKRVKSKITARACANSEINCSIDALPEGQRGVR
eukprot:3727938-Pyramimonas_sp.AAC.1